MHDLNPDAFRRTIIRAKSVAYAGYLYLETFTSRDQVIPPPRQPELDSTRPVDRSAGSGAAGASGQGCGPGGGLNPGQLTPDQSPRPGRADDATIPAEPDRRGSGRR
jgi:hypothetical protein